MGFFNIKNMKWKIIIILIIVQNNFLIFNTLNVFHGYSQFFFDIEQWVVYFTLLAPFYTL
jgi:hypothetical protein